MPAEIRKRKYSPRNCGAAKIHQIKRLEAELEEQRSCEFAKQNTLNQKKIRR